MALDKQPHNLAALLLGTAEFALAEGAATPAAAQLIGFRDFGNLTAFSVQSKTDKVEHKGSYRGTRRIDSTKFKETTSGYQLKADEANARMIALQYYGTQGSNYTQSSRSAVAVDALTSPVKDRWYDLLIGAVRVRELTAVAIVMASGSVVEDTDYVIDYKLGRIRWLVTPGTITSISVTAPAVTSTGAGTFAKITPMNKASTKGMGRLTVWNDDNSLVLDHYDFYCEVFPEGDASVAENITEFTLHVNLLTPGEVGAVPGSV